MKLISILFLTSLAVGCSDGDDIENGAHSELGALSASQVTLRSKINLGGRNKVLTVGDFDLSKDSAWNDQVESVRVPAGFVVTLYESAAFKGQALILTESSNTVGVLAGQVSSVQVRLSTGVPTPPSGDSTDSGPVPVPTPAPSPTPAPAPAPTTPVPPVSPVSTELRGWASVAGHGLMGTTGGDSVAPVVVTSMAQLNSLAGDTSPRVIHIQGQLSGILKVGSNKTLIGLKGASIYGSVSIRNSSNIIMKNLKLVGDNCDGLSDCQDGADVVAVDNSHHIWFDHLDISNGADGNLDLTHASDFVTVSWTKFSYSGRRPGGHQFSNLIGHSDSNASEDTGRLRITFDHVWWGENILERMPRVRFGQVHVLNSLFTATGNSHCLRLGVGAKVLAENNVFVGVNQPFDLAGGDVLSVGNIFTAVKGNQAGTNKGFIPPYAYKAEPASTVEASVKASAGPK